MKAHLVELCTFGILGRLTSNGAASMEWVFFVAATFFLFVIRDETYGGITSSYTAKSIASIFERNH